MAKIGFEAEQPEIMTVQGKLEKMLCDHGLWPAEATAVFDLMLERDTKGVFKTIHWSDSAEGEGAYPEQVLAAIWLTLKHYAAEWLAKHKPQHFARAMFSDT